ncbi:xanthine dehydrogenase [Rhodoplanes elegans]|uniref:Xanthine dehydrogenase n=1 Tax=Rhodoplanes elegans TaxID=29408 RepID=A0A327KSC5_9BRAD|nr:xanthine dehydrogenase [Rhodoplanes elegans]MBK5958013.1 xanthine dehydrogenase [Rhodoplanes elegans]RAI40896.1 xanthine dehydrogenase [Rhodoplanes elegans]
MFRPDPSRRLAVVLGTNEIASAVAVLLHRAGDAVVLAHDPNPPVIRRGMAFHDALYDDIAVVEEVCGRRADRFLDLAPVLAIPDTVAVTRLGLLDLIVHGRMDVLVDARLHKRAETPDLRHLAGITVGLGPGFAVGANCDVAVETRPVSPVRPVTQGRTEAADGVPSPLGGVGRERFVYSPVAGRWRSAVEIGKRVFVGYPVGRIDGVPVLAPMDGILRGAVRDGLEVPVGVKVIEVDPRGRAARWTGLDDRPRKIAEATLAAIDLKTRPLASARVLTYARDR